MNPQTKETTPESKLPHGLEHTVESLVSLGRMWAVHGIEIGRQALKVSAKSLEVTAQALGDVAARIRKPDTSEATDTATPVEPAATDEQTPPEA